MNIFPDKSEDKLIFLNLSLLAVVLIALMTSVLIYNLNNMGTNKTYVTIENATILPEKSGAEE